ncbi:MAG: AbrB/MazE/SpoVT family DNA-binding domain-containing protein [Planctomycetes bacterium]|nr:AbrB/MazE/SpoVT family DNA-binding domain-containing protein [Planctomycetota bacterium]
MLKKTTVPPPEGCQVRLGARGRFVLPAGIRRSMKLRPGDAIAIIPEPDGSFRILSVRDAVRRVRGLYAHLAPGRSLSRELIAERRREAAREEQE